MAGELIVTIAHRPSLGGTLEQARDLNDYTGMMATMVAILVIGLVLDSLVFGRLERTVLRRRGLARRREVALPTAAGADWPSPGRGDLVEAP